MTMQSIHSPKPKIFGVGYGAHLAYNLRLVKQFIKVALQVFINAFVPCTYYEKAHWQVIELYHRMRGFRHGTESDHRCKECGTDMLSNDETNQLREDVKELALLRKRMDEISSKLDEVESPTETLLADQPPTANEE